MYSYNDFRNRANDSDANTAVFYAAMLDKLQEKHIIRDSQYISAINDVSKQIDLFQSIQKSHPKLMEELSSDAINSFIYGYGKYDFNALPPTMLARAYRETKQKLSDKKLSNNNRNFYTSQLNKIADRIDELINDFTNETENHFVDVTNIADVFSGYCEMLDVRGVDIDQNVADACRRKLILHISRYDTFNRIRNITASKKSLEKLNKNYDFVARKTERWTPDEYTMSVASKYRFLDKDGVALPQFIDENGTPVLEYQDGVTIDKNGRLAAVVDLARHDVILRNLGEDMDRKSGQEIEQELDDGVLYKLFEIDTAEKIANGIQENPERFSDPQQLQDFIDNLNQNGASVSESGFQAAMDFQVNKTAGFAARIKQKLGKFGDHANTLFEKMFKPIQKIDKQKNDRMFGRSASDSRQKRIDLFLRVLKGFSGAFLFSGILTMIATIGATISGVGVMTTIAVLSVLTSIMISVVQIKKWRDAQIAAGLGAGYRELLRDARMMTTLGTTAIAAIAMTFGAAGLSAAAIKLGYGAMAIGGTNNAISTFRDAKSSGMNNVESAAWAIANAVAVVGGGFAGRAVAAGLMSDMSTQTTETTKTYEKTGEHVETHTEYKPETLAHAERIAKMWYHDNPDLLQQRLDMINDYNTAHGTNINPYRAIILNADAGGITADKMSLYVEGGNPVNSNGNHLVMTSHWAKENGFSTDEINALRHMFDGNGISDDAINAAIKADAHVSPTNEIGNVTNRPEYYDAPLQKNSVDINGKPVYTTYTNGTSPYNVTQTVVPEYSYVEHQTQTGVKIEVTGIMGTIGNYLARHRAGLKKRIGALADKIGFHHNNIVDDETPTPIETIESELPEWDDVDEQHYIGMIDDFETNINRLKRRLSEEQLSNQKRKQLKAQLKYWEQRVRSARNKKNGLER